MLITRPVGDIFVYSVPDAPMEVWLKVEKSEDGGCRGCIFRGIITSNCVRPKDNPLVGYCCASNRTDDNDVIFKQIGTYKPQKGVEYGD